MFLKAIEKNNFTDNVKTKWVMVTENKFSSLGGCAHNTCKLTEQAQS